MVRDGPSFFQNKACTCWVMSSYSRTQVWKVQRWLSVLRYSTPQKCLSSFLIPVFQVMGTLCDKRGVYLFYKRQFWFRTPSTGLCDPEMLCPIVMNLWHTKNSVFSLETGSPAYHNVYSIHSQESRFLKSEQSKNEHEQTKSFSVKSLSENPFSNNSPW